LLNGPGSISPRFADSPGAASARRGRGSNDAQPSPRNRPFSRHFVPMSIEISCHNHPTNADVRQVARRHRKRACHAVIVAVSRRESAPFSPDRERLPRRTLVSLAFCRAWWQWLKQKAEPPPTRDVNRDGGSASANGGWLRRLVRQLGLVLPKWSLAAWPKSGP
jgi:hypothetical protein